LEVGIRAHEVQIIFSPSKDVDPGLVSDVGDGGRNMLLGGVLSENNVLDSVQN